jgi:hypothetical protein
MSAASPRQQKVSFQALCRGVPGCCASDPGRDRWLEKFSAVTVAALSDNFTTGIFVGVAGMAREIWSPPHRAPHVGAGIACVAMSRLSQGHRPPHCSLIVTQSSARWLTHYRSAPARLPRQASLME